MTTNTITPNRRILLIDDNESIHQDFRKILSPATPGKNAMASAAAELFGQEAVGRTETNFEIDSAFQGQEGLEKVREAVAAQCPYAMAFVDLRMPPGWDGIETIDRIWREYPELQVVVCTAYSDYSLDKIVARLGRSDRLLILKKPFDAIEVLQFADALTEKWRLGREARAKMEGLEEIVAERTRELREGQQQLIEARKMETVGKLAGGIAHDFNTLLTAIIGHAELIQQVAEAKTLPFQSAVEIGKSATIAATLTRQLLAFSRKQMLQPETLDVNAAVSRIEPRLRQLLGASIQVSTVAGARQPWTRADVGQLQEVLVSLAHNARDAMPRGGDLIIETADFTQDAAQPSRDSDLGPGDYVTISITDTGCGIADEVKPQLFEPYFTTKKTGEGKGLGLAMCYGILKQSGGHIAFKSELGRGTTFKVYLPRLQAAEPEEPAEPPASALLPEPVAGTPGTGIILLVEPDAALRGAAGAVLERSGYTVHRAASSREAISIAGRAARIDLLLADSAMPEMTGHQLAKWLCSLHPDIKVLFTSTVDEHKSARDGITFPEADFLRKPYTPALLALKARTALSGAASKAREQVAAGV